MPDGRARDEFCDHRGAGYDRAYICNECHSRVPVGKRWVCAVCKDDYCAACKAAPENAAGFNVACGTGCGCKETYYCGRRLGRAAIPGSDGPCGPTISRL